MPALEHRPLGPTGISASVLGFGAMELRGTPHRNPRPLSDDQVREVLHAVLDAGIDYIDTSIDYGESEERIGQWLAGRRDEFRLASKAGCPLEHRPDATPGRSLEHDYTPRNIRAGIEQSLRRLRTDYLDLVQLHISPSVEVIRRHDAIAVLEEARDQGKVRSIGISSTLPNLPDHIALGVFEAFQIPYSGLEREHEAYLPLIAQAGAGVVVRGGVAQGGKRPKRTAAGEEVGWAQLGLEELLDGEDPQGFLLRFAIADPSVTTVIVGTASPEHVRHNAEAAARGPLPADVVAEAKRRLDAAGLTAAEPVPSA